MPKTPLTRRPRPAPKPAKPKRKPRESKARFPREVTLALAQCVYFALAYRKSIGRGGTRRKADGTLAAWEETFMDALDKVGFVIDRKAFWKEPKRGRK